MRKSWLTAASAVAAAVVETSQASAQLFSAPSTVDFFDTLVGSSTTAVFGVRTLRPITKGALPAAAPPFSGGPFSLVTSSKGAVLEATYDFDPTVIGPASDVLKFAVVSDKLHQGGLITLMGVGVAPVESLSVGASPVARIGTSSLQTVTVSNIGDGNLSGLGDPSNLHGNLAKLSTKGGVFKGDGGAFDLTDGSQTTFDYTFRPIFHGTATTSVIGSFQNGSADGTNQSSSEQVTLTGLGVGPRYESSITPGGVIDLGTIGLGSTGTAELDIRNATSDPDFGSPDLTGLSLLDAVVQQTTADFTLENFVAGAVLEGGSEEIGGGAFDLKVHFDATTLGEQTADLEITTDQDAAFGSAGQTFDYQLTADVVAVPEARTWEMLLGGFGLVGLTYVRGRRLQGAAKKPG